MDGEDSAPPAALSDGTRAFVDAHGGDVEVLASGKVRFVATGMEFPGGVSGDALARYRDGKAMRRAGVARRNGEFDFGALAPYIVPHASKREGKFLWCRLTERTLPRDAVVVERHCRGRRYVKALERERVKEAERERIREVRKEKARKRREAESGGKGKGKGKRGEGEKGKEGSGDEEMADASGEEGGEGVVGMSDDEAALVESAGKRKKKQKQRRAAGDDADAFWVRGRDDPAPAPAAVARPAAKEEANDDDSDEWDDLASAIKRKQPGKKAARRGPKVVALAEDPLKMAVAPDPVQEPQRGAKRRREKGGVQKKSRRPKAKARVAKAGGD